MSETLGRDYRLLNAKVLEDRLPDDRLLAQFASTRSPAAFEAVVRRHAGLVYGAAMRQVRDANLADEITQSVFVLLSRKATSMSSDCVLAGWLLKTTRFVALDAKKMRERRRRHETRAAAMHVDQVTDQDAVAAIDNAELLNALDDGLLTLKSSDRRAILMRFYERKTYDDVGRHMGIDAEAARKRVGRAVERLREYFVHRKGRSTISATSTAAVIALLGIELRAEAPPQVIARAIRSPSTGAGNALADLANGHLRRVNLLRWSLVAAAFGGLVVVSGNTLRTTLSRAAAAVTHSSQSADFKGN